MAYTYENFTTAAEAAGLLSGFSEDDLKIAQTNPEFGLSVLKLRQDAAGATTEEQKLLAQEAENQLRTSFAAKNSDLNYGNYSFEKQTPYQELLEKAANYERFEYNPETNVRYQAYKKGYLREADRAREDTLAKTSAATGGAPSSWAINAASQAGNYYTGKLNDIVPTLYDDAYSQHMSDYNALLNGLAAMREERDFDYAAWLQDWNNAMQLYNMGQRTPEVLEILGIPQTVSSGGGWQPGSNKGYSAYLNPKPADTGKTGSLLDGSVSVSTPVVSYPWLTPSVGSGKVPIGSGR